jgi:hypothetical protein
MLAVWPASTAIISEWHKDAQAIFTRNWFGPGSGTGTSLIMTFFCSCDQYISQLCLKDAVSIPTGSQLPAFIVPYPFAGVILELGVFGERCECAFAASSTDADISTSTSKVWHTLECSIRQD